MKCSRTTFAMTLMALLSLTCASSVLAGARPGSKDAACDDLQLALTTKQSNLDKRELNFFLFDAADLGCVDIIKKVLGDGASVHARDRAGNTAFLLAARKGHQKAIEMLIEKSSDIEQKNLLGSSALLLAVTHNRRKTSRFLLDQGLDPNDSNVRELTPLITAVYNGNARIVSMLLEAGAEPDTQDASGKGPLVYAAGKGFHRIAELLVDTGSIDMNTRYGNDLTALMWAAGFSNDVPRKDGNATVQLLLDNGADVDLVDNRGRSALHIAAERGHVDVVQLLLGYGADATMADAEGLRPSDLATDIAVESTLNNYKPDK